MPHTIAENLQRLQTATAAIGNAIVAKGGTVGANDGLEEYPADIATIPTGGITPAETKDVNFYDYDGACVYSYTADEFAELTAMPANPSHAGLTAQGWNWSLSDAKAYVAKYGQLIIGQMYVTSDGKSRIYITLQEGRISPTLNLSLDANSEVEIDWGDGSTHSIFTNVTSSASWSAEEHAFPHSGDYVITIEVISGGFSFGSRGNSFSSILIDKNNYNQNNGATAAYTLSIRKLEIGDNVTLGNYFSAGFNLVEITIPQNTTIKGNCFQSCSAKAVIIPVGITTAYYLFNTSRINVIAVPSGWGVGGDCFYACNYLAQITIPGGQSIAATSFYSCRSLSSLVLPDTITSIGSVAFTGCIGLSYFKFTSLTPPSIQSSNSFGNIASDCCILVPLNTLDDYLNETNMPDDSVYLYLCYAKYASGAELPATSTDGYSLTWYATKDDARNAVNPITVGNGKEVYAVGA